MTPPPPGMRYNIRHGFDDHGPLTGKPSRDLLLPTEEIPAAADRHRAAVVGVIVLGAYLLMLLGLTWYVAHVEWSPAPGPTVTPSTYGWPGPEGGPTG